MKKIALANVNRLLRFRNTRRILLETRLPLQYVCSSFAIKQPATMKGKKFIYAHKFDGMPKLTDLELVEEELPPLKDGEVLCEVKCLAIDPYMRPYAARSLKQGDVFLNHYVAGKVIDSKDEAFPAGTIVRGPMGCRTHAVMPGSKLTNMSFLQDLPLSTGLSVVGMPGLTAYFGLLKVCNPKEGETVYVNSAAGAVGAVVGQIAKIKGCRVVGSAGSDEKVAYCKSLGFDEVFNYKTVPSLEEALKAACPKGIDMFFENVGGSGFSTVMRQMNPFGRVAVCGAIAIYNQQSPPKYDDFLGPAISNQIKIEGFLVVRWVSEFPDASKQLVQWIKEGKLKPKEHITNGFENLPKAFLELFTGSNFGKAVVVV